MWAVTPMPPSVPVLAPIVTQEGTLVSQKRLLVTTGRQPQLAAARRRRELPLACDRVAADILEPRDERTELLVAQRLQIHLLQAHHETCRGRGRMQ